MDSAPASRVCYKCGWEAPGPDDVRCRQCASSQLKTPQQIRTLGWVLVVCGVFLLLLMGGVTVVVTQILLASGKPGATTRFTGDRTMILFIYGIFGLVLAFGGASLWAGVSQVRSARRNRKLVPVMLGIAGVLLIVGKAIQWFGD